MHVKENIRYSPGEENTNGGNTGSKENEQKDNAKNDPENKEKPSLIKKIKKALRDWAEDDQRDLDYDDTRV